MYIYCAKDIINPLYIHFLCGNKYVKKNVEDKRNILKSYIDSLNNNYALILEKLFRPSEYMDMGFKDLEEVELMASNYAKSIIILHETVSTAAEIALFGSKRDLKNKILVIYAPYSKIETDVVGSFIRFAYFKDNKIQNSEFDYNTKLHTSKKGNVSYYNTYFPNNKIDDIFKGLLDNFWKSSYTKMDISFNKYNVLCRKENYYKISKKNIFIKLNYEFILSIVLSILLNNDLIKEIRLKEDVVKNMCSLIKEILINTISTHELINIDDYSIDIKASFNQDINLPVRFCIYVLIKAGLINIRNEQISITSKFKMQNDEYKLLLQYIDEPNFFKDFEGDING